jgi:hypothetical protein
MHGHTKCISFDDHLVKSYRFLSSERERGGGGEEGKRGKGREREKDKRDVSKEAAQQAAVQQSDLLLFMVIETRIVMRSM